MVKNGEELAIARDVIELQIEGLRALSDSLSTGFEKTVALMAAANGRVIVSGVGKSGHVARKIAATLASTGKPAMFIHATEASHGDLGMITREDVILMLSKSGETSEIGDLLGYAARFSIPLAAITAGETSTLAKAADAVILLPPAAEASTQLPAPTTSTTMMMATGDAIAVALLKRRGFSTSEFQNFHPGGKLGAALKRVCDLMHHDRELPLCQEDTLVSDAIALSSEAKFGCVGIVDKDGRLAGIFTDGDVRRVFCDNVSAAPIASVMTPNPRTIKAETLAGEALALLSAARITALFVVDDANKPVGLLHVHDCLSSGVL